MQSVSSQSVLLYDGLCGFCDRTIQFIERRDKKRSMKFAALQGDFARDLFKRHAGLESIDSLVFVERRDATRAERVLVRGDAVMAIAKYLGGVWGLGGALLGVIPRPIRDALYDAFARRRFRVFGRLDACRVPTAELRSRFLD